MTTASAALPSSSGDEDGQRARPFLKWAGGKSQLLEQYRKLLPRRFERYHEPFVGGAAVFFSLRASIPTPFEAVLSDFNEELINCYAVVRDAVDPLIEALRKHSYDQEHYYAVRELDPADLTRVDRAARTIFLNRAGFNGLYRVNSGGRFNVPFGRYANPKICDADNLRACSAALRDVDLVTRDFGISLEGAEPGDFVYLDPPYTPLSSTANFTAYNAGGFGWKEQERLAGLFRDLAARRVKVMLSNSDVPEIRGLYEGFSIVEVQASRSINCKAGGRGKVGEVVILSYAR